MFGLNCASSNKGKKSPATVTITAPKSAPVKRKKFGGSTTGKSATSQAFETLPSRFTYLNFGSTATTGRREKFKRTPIFDYVPWSLLDR